MMVEDDGSADVIRSKLETLHYKVDELVRYWGDDQVIIIY